jgi:hypothetical protein
MRIQLQVRGNLINTSTIGSEATIYEATNECTVRDLLTQINVCESELRQIRRNGQEARLTSRLRPRDFLELA